VQELPLRWLVVDSTQLAKANAPRWAAAQQAAPERLAELRQPWQRRTLACAADAQQAATLGLRELRLHSPHLTYTVHAEGVPAKRATRGRPPKAAPRPQRQVWRVTWPPQEAMDAISRRAQRERRFVWATKVLDAPHLSAAELLRASNGQPAAELRFTWAKHPAAIAPLVLETPSRMAALAWVSLLALRVYTLVERHVRKGLVERGEPLPDRPAPRQRPTARTVFHLMRNMAVVTLPWAGPVCRYVTTLNAHQLHLIRRLGYAPSIAAIPHRNSG
jgi:transposase